ncbi:MULTISPECIES: hypothetical protein [Lacticaseibacillus]|uniref:Uncharacterized protein n=2 Tax=Lacticaseibacillus TaxID=2759736 RepID=A0ABW4CGM3_9LACO|nr:MULTISPECIES: hypothetical protein [Lacticaseibacillus]
MSKSQLQQLLTWVVIIILALVLLPFVGSVIGLIIKVILFLAIVAGLYWAYVTFIKK